MAALAEINTLMQATGSFKELLRRFAEIMTRFFEAPEVSVARLSGLGPRLTLKPRGIKPPPGVSLWSDHLLAPLAEALRPMSNPGGQSAKGADLDVFREGYSTIATSQGDMAIALLDDPGYRDGTLLVFRPQLNFRDEFGLSGEFFRHAVLDQLTRTLQSQARWYRKLEQTEAMLRQDDLTGLYNMRYLEVALDNELLRAQRFGSTFCLLFIDLDGFKSVNDQHGHASGSMVLKEVAQVLRDAVREVDSPIRYGGDEFVVVLLGASSAKGLLVAERIRRHIEQKEFRLEDGHVLHLTASIGVAAYPEHARDRESLLRMADETMYHSKKKGKNQVTMVASQNLSRI